MSDTRDMPLLRLFTNRIFTIACAIGFIVGLALWSAGQAVEQREYVLEQ